MSKKQKLLKRIRVKIQNKIKKKLPHISATISIVFNKDTYILTSYKENIVKYGEEVDGEHYPNRNEYLQKKQDIRAKIKDLKLNLRIGLGKVRR